MTPILEARNVTKAFGGLTAVDRVSCSVEPGSVTAIIGPNGAGKTTFFNCITGIAPPTAGEILFKGKPLEVPVAERNWRVPRYWDLWLLVNYARVAALSFAGRSPHRITRLGMARTFQNIRLFKDMTALENVVTGGDCRQRTTIAGALLRTPSMRRSERDSFAKAADLLEFVGLSRWRNVPARNLPYGDQRRLEIARAMATCPELLLLDEPAAGMNPRESLELVDLIARIRDRGLTVILIEHHMKVVMRISSHVIVLDHGEKIADGTPEEVRANPAVIEAYLGREEVH